MRNISHKKPIQIQYLFAMHSNNTTDNITTMQEELCEPGNIKKKKTKKNLVRGKQRIQ